MVGDVAHLARRAEQANNILEKQQQRAEEKEKNRRKTIQIGKKGTAKHK